MSFEHYIRAAEQLWIPHLLAKNREGQRGDDHDSNHHNASSSSSGMATTTTTTILVTTESRAVLQEQEAFLAKYDLQRDFAFPFRIINNRHDVMQGTGFINDALAAAVTAAGAAAAATAPQETLPVERIRRRLDNTSTATTIAIANNAVEQVATLDADAVMLSAVSSLKAQLMANVVIGNCCSNFHQLLRELIGQGCGGAGIGGGHVGSTTFYCLQDHPNPDYRLCCSWDKSSRCMEKRQRRQRGKLQHPAIGSNNM